MRLVLLFSVFLLCSLFGYGQIKFFKIFSDNGYDYGQGIVQLEDSSYLLTGCSSSFSEGPSQVFLIKLDSLGEFLWSKNYGGSEADWGRRVLNWNDSIFFIAGFSNSLGTGSYNFYLNKIDKYGTQILEKQYDHIGWEKLHDALITTDSLIYMVGETTGTTNGDRNFYVVKTDHNGDTLWMRNFGTNGDDVARSIKQYNDTTFFIVGEQYNSDSTMTKAAIIKMYANGDIAWVKEFGAYGNYVLNDLIISGTNLSAVGSRVYPNGGDFDEYRLKSDIDGNFNGEENIHSEGNLIYDQICKYGPPNSTYIASHFQNEFSALGSYDAGITKFYEDLVWDVAGISLNIVASTDDIPCQIIPTNDGGAVFAGYMSGTNLGGSSVFVLKVGPNNDFPTIDLSNINNIVALSELELGSNSYAIFPNPTNNWFKIQSVEDVELLVRDINGKIVCYRIVSNGQEIDTQNWQKGIYFVQIKLQDGSSKIVKLIVQ